MAQGPEARARRVQRRGEVKARLSAGMLAVAVNRPYSTITVEDIAGAAGISRSTFYFYYRDKGELLIDTAREIVARHFSEGEDYWHGIDESRALVRKVLAHNARTFADHAALLRTIMEVSTFDQQVKEFWYGHLAEFIAAVAARIRAEQEAGLVSAEVDADRYADALVVATEGYLFRAVDGERDQAEEAIRVLTEIWNRILYLESTAPADPGA